jgi:hypothetical protein
MGELILGLVPVALGVVLSPLAIMALVAVLLSQNARANGSRIFSAGSSVSPA